LSVNLIGADHATQGNGQKWRIVISAALLLILKARCTPQLPANQRLKSINDSFRLCELLLGRLLLRTATLRSHTGIVAVVGHQMMAQFIATNSLLQESVRLPELFA